MTWATLFDLEGTLVQTLWENPEHVLEFRVQTRKKLIDLAIPSCILEGIERSPLMRNEASEYVKRNFSDNGRDRSRNAKGISIIVKRNLMEEVYLQADYSVQSLSEVPSIIQNVIGRQSLPL